MDQPFRRARDGFYADAKPPVNRDQRDQQCDHHDHADRELKVVETNKPSRIKDAAYYEQPANALEMRIVALSWQHLINAESNQERVNHAPDTKRVVRREVEKIWIAVSDLCAGEAV